MLVRAVRLGPGRSRSQRPSCRGRQNRPALRTSSEARAHGAGSQSCAGESSVLEWSSLEQAIPETSLGFGRAPTLTDHLAGTRHLIVGDQTPQSVVCSNRMLRRGPDVLFFREAARSETDACLGLVIAQ